MKSILLYIIIRYIIISIISLNIIMSHFLSIIYVSKFIYVSKYCNTWSRSVESWPRIDATGATSVCCCLLKWKLMVQINEILAILCRASLWRNKVQKMTWKRIKLIFETSCKSHKTLSSIDAEFFEFLRRTQSYLTFNVYV